MDSSKSYRFVSVCVLVLVFASVGFSASSQQSARPTGAQLKKEMYDLEKSSFQGIEVTPEAQHVMRDLIDKAVAAYNQPAGKGRYNEIIENFGKLLNAIKSFREQSESPRRGGLGMIGLATSSLITETITVNSIKKALTPSKQSNGGICPLWPFC